MIRTSKVIIFVLLMVFVASNADAELIDLPKTGQTILYETGDDGDLQKGVAWPSPRFTVNGDGTVKDNLTGLIWLQDANCDGVMAWSNALDQANELFDGCSDCGGTDEDCGLSDDSSAGDWRLPNIKELQSLIDFSENNPVLPSGHPFTDVQSSEYWSSSTNANDTVNAWRVFISDGATVSDDKSIGYYVWPVRDATDEEEGVSQCFIASAAYGSPIEPYVNILPIAHFIANHDRLRSIERLILLPLLGVCWVALKLGPVSTILPMLLFGVGIFGFVRVRRNSKANQ